MAKTVSVPESLTPLFDAAEQTVAAYFGRKSEQPERGLIEIGGERYVLVRASSLSVDFHDVLAALYDDPATATKVASDLLFHLAQTVGKTDAAAVHAEMGLHDPVARLSAGPVHFAYAGWAFVELLPECNPVAGDDFVLVYNHPYSFESASWINAGRRADRPICAMNAGYSSGWTSASFGMELAATEILCLARGDDCCRFVMAPPHRLEEAVAGYLAQHPELTTPHVDASVPGRIDALELAGQLERAEAERARLEHEMRQLQKLEALGTLAGGVAHDFNNLLMVIGANLEQLEEQLDDPATVVRRLRAARRAVDQSSDIVRELLAFARAGQDLDQQVDLAKVVAEAVARCEHALASSATYTASPAVTVRGNEGYLRQVVANLLCNALDALDGATQGPEVTITLRQERRAPPEGGAKDVVGICVRDNGCGMDAATQKRMFEPFFTTKGAGSGLGLSTVYGIVHQHGGWLDVRSEPGRGSEVTAWLPLASDAEDSAPISLDDPDARGGTILLVEDERALREIVAEILSSQGYTVTGVADGDAALAAFAPGAFDIVLLDLTMPGLSGREVLERILQRDPDQDVVVTSGYSNEGAANDVLALGARAFLAKPFGASDVLRCFDKLLRRRDPSR